MIRQLVIVERAHRGAVEKQYYDCLHGIELHRRLGPVDVLLRGAAVTYAARASRTPSLRLGERELTTLTEPSADLRRLLDDGVRVWAEEPDLATYRLTGSGLLLDGVRRAAAGELAAHWASYDLVYFF